MPAVTIADVPDHLLARIQRRAVADRRSLDQEFVALLERALGRTEAPEVAWRDAGATQAPAPGEVDAGLERARLTEQLVAVLVETRQRFSDIQHRQFTFARFKTIAMDRLWDAFRDGGKYHQQLALQVRMAVRKLNSLELTTAHLDAMISILQKLFDDDLTRDDVKACKRILRRSGIDVVTRLGERITDLIPLYDDGAGDS